MILVAGSANLDFVVRTPHIPAPGETVLGGEFRTYPGGKGANQAVACALAGGAETEMLLALGNDAFAAPIEQSLRVAGVRAHVVRVSDVSTGAAFICVADDAQNAITVAPGANYTLRPSHLPPLDGVTHLLLQLEIPLETLVAYAQVARARGITVVLNAAPARALPSELLAALDVLVVNETELALISRDAGEIERGLARIDVPSVVATLGENGCCARIGHELIRQPAFPVTAVDTTAAGDTFCGVLVAGLSRDLGMAGALRQASAAAALACTRAGAQSSIPTHRELQSFLRQHAAVAQRA
ncbi:MAG TPA: ribokinase [Steroidobacteraceae bacterium]|jgi:ribokinase|nr:ribokinase [Steroidobacteraceae bacterium]